MIQREIVPCSGDSAPLKGKNKTKQRKKEKKTMKNDM